MHRMMLGLAAAAMLVGAAAPATTAMAQPNGYYDRYGNWHRYDNGYYRDRDRDRDYRYNNGYRGYHYGWRNNRCRYNQRGWYDQWHRWHWC